MYYLRFCASTTIDKRCPIRKWTSAITCKFWPTSRFSNREIYKNFITLTKLFPAQFLMICLLSKYFPLDMLLNDAVCFLYSILEFPSSGMPWYRFRCYWRFVYQLKRYRSIKRFGVHLVILYKVYRPLISDRSTGTTNT